jgi:pimeloyl-ACP methyl ester carboxylesterase
MSGALRWHPRVDSERHIDAHHQRPGAEFPALASLIFGLGSRSALPSDSAPYRALALIAWGTDDSLFGLEWAQELRAKLGDRAHLVEIPSGRLFFPLKRPDELAALLIELWDRDRSSP